MNPAMILLSSLRGKVNLAQQFSIQKFIAKQGYKDLRLRGLKLVELDQTTRTQFVEAEFLIVTQDGLLSFGQFLHSI